MVRHYHKVKHYVRRGLISAAFVLFFCDLIAPFVPPFDKVWSNVAHVAVAFASFAAFITEHWLHEEFEALEKEERHGG